MFNFSCYFTVHLNQTPFIFDLQYQFCTKPKLPHQSDDETGFTIDRSANVTPRNYTPIGSVVTPTTTFTDTNVQPNTIYYYQ
ncbi:MAG: hypothetical protein AB1489_43420, partial [Acidobacteriota bacterium]